MEVVTGDVGVVMVVMVVVGYCGVVVVVVMTVVSSPPIWFSSHCRMENLSQSRTSQQVFRRKRWPKKGFSGKILFKFTNISSFRGGKNAIYLF